MTISVQYSTRKFEAAMRRLTGQLSRQRRPYARAARASRDFVRKTIKDQGGARPYDPLSSWTKFKTGRQKALLPLIPRIKARWGNNFAEVYFDGRGKDYDATQHHRGYRFGPVKKPKKKSMKVSGRRLNMKARFFTKRKGGRVPARKIWPTKGELAKIVTPIFHTWVKNSARKEWR